MTELFDRDGHLTGQGLAALAAGGLEELERLEAAEHLSFCDRCLARYTDLLTGGTLLEPPADQTLPVMRRLRRRAASALASRYAAAAAALAITGTLWYTGVFEAVAGIFVADGRTLAPPPAQSQQAPAQSGSSAILQAVDAWSEKVKETLRPAYTAPRPGGPDRDTAADTAANPTQDKEWTQ